MCDLDPDIAEKRAILRYQFNIQTICNKYSRIAQDEEDLVVDLRNLQIIGNGSSMDFRVLGSQVDLLCSRPKLHKRHYDDKATEFAKFVEEMGQTDLFQDAGGSGFADDLQSVVSCNTCVSACVRSYDDCLKAAKQVISGISTPQKVHKRRKWPVPLTSVSPKSNSRVPRRVSLRALENGVDEDCFSCCESQSSGTSTVVTTPPCGSQKKSSLVVSARFSLASSFDFNPVIPIEKDESRGQALALITKRPRMVEDFVYREISWSWNQGHFIDEAWRLYQARLFLGQYDKLGLPSEDSVKILVNGNEVFSENHCNDGPVVCYSASFNRQRFAQWLDLAVMEREKLQNSYLPDRYSLGQFQPYRSPATLMS